ncbi:MAG TPA: FkbM family methyltransferase [Pseudolabrys sp.]|nr:FkbM family methyltransferase [Pseudolabrys sp.]
MIAAQRLARPAKDMLRKRFPSLWVRWHLAHSAIEPELGLLRYIVPRDGIAVDIGANFGVYSRELARLTDTVHAFEPSKSMADMLRRTAPRNVVVHETALSDHAGEAALRTPEGADGPVYSLASIEPNPGGMTEPFVSVDVPLARLDSVLREHVGFVKIDVEGHELKVLEGARGLLERSKPIFLVEAEERHRRGAVASVCEFFRRYGYRGFFMLDSGAHSTEEFEAALLQDHGSLQSDGSRKPGRAYVNNFFFFPPTVDGRRRLANAAQSRPN